MFRISHVYTVNRSAPGYAPTLYQECDMVYIRTKDIVQVMTLFDADISALRGLPSNVKRAYQIRFKTHSVTFNGYDLATSIGIGLIHPDDFDRFERYINGTENPIHDLIEVFRSHPIFGTETAEAKKRFVETLNSL